MYSKDHSDLEAQEGQTSPLTRRTFFSRVARRPAGSGSSLFAGKRLVFGQPGAGSSGRGKVYDLKPHLPHFEPRAKSVIHLFMNGETEPRVDLFDPKPLLEKYSGQPRGETWPTTLNSSMRPAA